jgi:hypothetical protein
MKAIFQRSGTYRRTRDTLSWFLVIEGFVVIAMLSESIRLHREVGPHGGHHGDVAGGLGMLGFLFLMVPFIFAFAGVGALLGKSKTPLIGAILGWIASIPILLVLGICRSLLLYISPFLAIPFPFVVGIAFVIMGFLRKTKTTTNTCMHAL